MTMMTTLRLIGIACTALYRCTIIIMLLLILDHLTHSNTPTWMMIIFILIAVGSVGANIISIEVEQDKNE